MFRVLRASYDKLPDGEKAEVGERDISFRGFDYSDDEETALPGYVEYLFADDRYTELAVPLSRFSDDGNSHHRNLDIYRRMLHCFNQLWRKHIISFDLLSLDEIKQVVSAPPQLQLLGGDLNGRQRQSGSDKSSAQEADAQREPADRVPEGEGPDVRLVRRGPGCRHPCEEEQLPAHNFVPKAIRAPDERPPTSASTSTSISAASWRFRPSTGRCARLSSR